MEIFISYRRADSVATANTIADALKKEFGAKNVFIDTGISAGEKWEKQIFHRISRSDAFLAVIGTQWLDTADENGTRRLHDPDDIVRQEIKMALRQDIPLIPVLVNNASLPSLDDLPEDIRSLLEHQAFVFGSAADFPGLVSAIKLKQKPAVGIDKRLFYGTAVCAAIIIAALLAIVLTRKNDPQPQAPPPPATIAEVWYQLNDAPAQVIKPDERLTIQTGDKLNITEINYISNPDSPHFRLNDRLAIEAYYASDLCRGLCNTDGIFPTGVPLKAEHKLFPVYPPEDTPENIPTLVWEVDTGWHYVVLILVHYPAGDPNNAYTAIDRFQINLTYRED